MLSALSKFVAVSALALLVASPANATVLTFEGLDSFQVPNGYGGLDWNNFNLANFPNPTAGYYYGAVSPDHVAYNSSAAPASFMSSTPFTLNSAYFTAAWNTDLEVELTAWRNDIQVFNKKFTVGPLAPTLVNFNWANIDSVLLETSGGTDYEPFMGSGAHVAIDNMVVNAVPLPAALPLFAVAAAGLGGIASRRRKQA